MVKACTHGKSWTEPCLRCELVGKREFVATMAPRVERAKERIKELERSILADELEAARHGAQNKGNPDVLMVGPSGGPYVPETRRES